MGLLVRWVVTALSLFVAAWLVPGIHVNRQGWVAYAGMAVVLGLVNAIVRPILQFLSCPLIILTMGVFILVINGLTMWLASSIARQWFDIGFYVDGFWPAFWGALIVSITSMILTALVREEAPAVEFPDPGQAQALTAGALSTRPTIAWACS